MKSQQNEENNEKKMQLKQLKKKRLKINIQTCWDSNPDFRNASAVLSNQWSYIYIINQLNLFINYKLVCNNRPFYGYGGHIELIRFKEYYRMPRGYEHISFVFFKRFSEHFFLKFS